MKLISVWSSTIAVGVKQSKPLLLTPLKPFKYAFTLYQIIKHIRFISPFMTVTYHTNSLIKLHSVRLWCISRGSTFTGFFALCVNKIFYYCYRRCFSALDIDFALAFLIDVQWLVGVWTCDSFSLVLLNSVTIKLLNQFCKLAGDGTSVSIKLAEVLLILVLISIPVTVFCFLIPFYFENGNLLIQNFSYVSFVNTFLG